MCGIVGFATPKPLVGYTSRSNFLIQGLVVDSLRGTGGTGMALVRGAGEIEIHKRALSGADFINTQVAEIGFKNFDDVRVAIGHNRAATIGSVKDKNCHPFHYKDRNEIALVHNGTLHNYYGLNPGPFNHDVDSAHAAMAIASGEDTQKILKEINGPFVFVWWNGTDHTLNIARNEFREIYYIYGKEGELFFASEYRMLEWLLDRNNIERSKKGYLFPQDHNWVSWKFDEKGNFTDKPKVVDISPEKKPFSYPQRFTDNDTRKARREFRRGGIAHLDTLGLKRGDILICEILRFEHYDYAQRSTTTGKIICTPKFTQIVEEVWLHSKTPQEFERLKKECGLHFPVRVQTAITSWETGTNEEEFVIIGEYTEKDVKAVEELSKRKLKEAVGKELSKEVPEESSDSELVLFQGPNDSWLTRKEWDKKVGRGCAYCNQKPEGENPAGVLWLEDYSTGQDFLCEDCTKIQDAREIVGLLPLDKGSSLEGGDISQEDSELDLLTESGGFGTARLN